MKKIAIVTGASSGMGQWFARTAKEYVEFDELWIIARRADRLEALAAELAGEVAAGGESGQADAAELAGEVAAGGESGQADAAELAGEVAAGGESGKAGAAKLQAEEQAGAGEAAGAGYVRCIPMDLTDEQALGGFADELAKEKEIEIALLVNAAGFGKFQAVEDVPMKTADGMLALNCKALMDMCYTCIPYMGRGSKILNIASVAAFQPVPYVTEYAATKAFVLSFSRGLWTELKSKGITVTALCPYWTKTEFFDVANNRTGKDRVTYFNAMYEPEDVVRRGWRDLLKGRDVSTFGVIARAQVVLVKLLPQRLVMWIWCRQQGV